MNGCSTGTGPHIKEQKELRPVQWMDSHSKELQFFSSLTVWLRSTNNRHNNKDTEDWWIMSHLEVREKEWMFLDNFLFHFVCWVLTSMNAAATRWSVISQDRTKWKEIIRRCLWMAVTGRHEHKEKEKKRIRPVLCHPQANALPKNWCMRPRRLDSNFFCSLIGVQTVVASASILWVHVWFILCSFSFEGQSVRDEEVETGPIKWKENKEEDVERQVLNSSWKIRPALSSLFLLFLCELRAHLS